MEKSLFEWVEFNIMFENCWKLSGLNGFHRTDAMLYLYLYYIIYTRHHHNNRGQTKTYFILCNLFQVIDGWEKSNHRMLYLQLHYQRRSRKQSYTTISLRWQLTHKHQHTQHVFLLFIKIHKMYFTYTYV